MTAATLTKKSVESNKTIAEWEAAKHEPTGKIFIVTKIDRGYLLDHHGVKYGQDQCSHFPIHCGMTTQQKEKYGNPEFSPLKECWKRAKSQAWEECDRKVGDIVSPKYGKRAGRKIVIELFDHTDRTIGMGNFQYWYPEKYLITDCDRTATIDMFDSKETFEYYLAFEAVENAKLKN